MAVGFDDLRLLGGRESTCSVGSKVLNELSPSFRPLFDEERVEITLSGRVFSDDLESGRLDRTKAWGAYAPGEVFGKYVKPERLAGSDSKDSLRREALSSIADDIEV